MIRVRSLLTVISGVLLAALILTACSSGSSESPASAPDSSAAEIEADDDHADESEEGEAEHDDEGEGAEHVEFEVPSAYVDLVNPLDGDPEAIAGGANLYATTCASCHGDTGMGDGPAGLALDPKPASLADGDMMAEMSDGSIFWRITEGGTSEPFNSAMPPWGSVYSEDQIWQLISFLRTLPGE